MFVFGIPHALFLTYSRWIFFCFLPNFSLVNVLASFFDVVFNQNALVTDSKSEKEQIER